MFKYNQAAYPCIISEVLKGGPAAQLPAARAKTRHEGVDIASGLDDSEDWKCPDLFSDEPMGTGGDPTAAAKYDFFGHVNHQQRPPQVQSSSSSQSPPALVTEMKECMQQLSERITQIEMKAANAQEETRKSVQLLDLKNIFFYSKHPGEGQFGWRGHGGYWITCGWPGRVDP